MGNAAAEKKKARTDKSVLFSLLFQIKDFVLNPDQGPGPPLAKMGSA
jgi:hypothetical protein